MIDRSVLRARATLAVYLAFSLAIVAFDFWSRSQKDLRESLVPLTGWTGLFSYLWTVQFVIFALIKTNRPMFMAVVWMLGGVTAINAVDTAFHAVKAWSGSPDYGNPYLMYHPARPLIIVVIPCVWLSVLWLAGRKLPKITEPNQPTE